MQTQERFRPKKDFFIISIFTFLAVIIWVGLEVYWTWQKSTIASPTQTQMKTLNPTLQKGIFDKLNQKIGPNEDQIKQAVNTSIPTPTIAPSQEASENGTLKNTATTSGQTEGL